MLGRTRIGHDTGSPSSYDVELGLSSDILVTVRVADSERVSSLASACCEDLLSVWSGVSLEESVCSESLSFLEFSEHGI